MPGRATGSFLHTPDADQLVRDLVRTSVDFTDLQVRPASLEEAFLALTDDLAAPFPRPDEGAPVQRAVMSTCLFTYGVGVAEDRALPWDSYVRRAAPATSW